jgi:hypothetical protein
MPDLLDQAYWQIPDPERPRWKHQFLTTAAEMYQEYKIPHPEWLQHALKEDEIRE